MQNHALMIRNFRVNTKIAILIIPLINRASGEPANQNEDFNKLEALPYLQQASDDVTSVCVTQYANYPFIRLSLGRESGG